MTIQAPQILTIKQPIRGAVPLVVDSPHSGLLLPEDFDFACALSDLRQSDEFYIDAFGAKAAEHGGAFLKALISRAYIDLNRAPGDLHPSLCAEKIPWPLHRSRRVQCGIGLIRHLVRPNEPIYARKLGLAEIERRIHDYYDPYYAALGELLQARRTAFGRVLHVNLHAMPSIGADSKPLPDIVIGDHDGHSASRIWRELVKKTFEAHGLKVVVNDPYKGAELTSRFAKPRQGIHCLQVEVNKALYMNEETFAATNDMAMMLRVFDDLWKVLAHALTPALAPARVPAIAQHHLPRAAE